MKAMSSDNDLTLGVCKPSIYLSRRPEKSFSWGGSVKLTKIVFGFHVVFEFHVLMSLSTSLLLSAIASTLINSTGPTTSLARVLSGAIGG